MTWMVWWIWVAFGIGLGILEVIVPGYIFLGFAIGAVMTGVLIGLGLTASVSVLILTFGLISLASWFVLRQLFGVRRGQVKIWDRDINE